MNKSDFDGPGIDMWIDYVTSNSMPTSGVRIRFVGLGKRCSLARPLPEWEGPQIPLF